MPDTKKRVRICTGHYADRPWVPVVLVDGEPLEGVTRIVFDHSYEYGAPRVAIHLVGIDSAISADLEATPDYLVKVIGPGPPDASSERPS